MNKKNILLVSAIGTSLIIIVTLLSITDFCYYSVTCSGVFEKLNPWGVINYIFPVVPIFILSLVTYKLREEVFQAWWRFARWFAPVIVAATLFINYQSSGGGFGISGAVGGGFDAIVLALFYLTFVSVSAVIIFTNWALMRFNGQYPKRIKFIKLALLTIAILFSLPTAALAILMVATAYNQALF